MIKLITNGAYKLIETKGNTKILSIEYDEKHLIYVWINAGDRGKILVTTPKRHKVDHALAVGKYRLYEVKNEPKLRLTHLELLVGDGVWQGYLLPKGFPNSEKRGRKIIPTNEIITKSTH